MSKKISFGVGAPKCTVCAKSVYDMEKVLAIEQVWHKSCFTCGAHGTNGACRRVLTLDRYENHLNEPFCKNCHVKLFGIRGYGFGSGAGVLNSYVVKSENAPSTSGKIEVAEVSVAPVVNSVEYQSPRPAPPVTPAVRQSVPVPAPAPASVPVPPAPPASRTSKLGAGAPKCTCCNKSVYAAEKVQAINRIWHKSCFTCGGTGSDGGCKKTLTLDSYLDHGEDPYCKPCHGKLFGIKGFGYGMSASVLSTYPTEEAVSREENSDAQEENVLAEVDDIENTVTSAVPEAAAPEFHIVTPAETFTLEYDQHPSVVEEIGEHTPIDAFDCTPVEAYVEEAFPEVDPALLREYASLIEQSGQELDHEEAYAEEAHLDPDASVTEGSEKYQPEQEVGQTHFQEDLMQHQYLEADQSEVDQARYESVEQVELEQPELGQSQYQEAEQAQYQEAEQPQYQEAEQPQYQEMEQPQHLEVEQPQHQEMEQIGSDFIHAPTASVEADESTDRESEGGASHSVGAPSPLHPAAVHEYVPAPTPALTPVPAASGRSSVSPRFGTGAPKCTCCNKSVYAAEKVQAINRIWHKSCFTCGGTGSDGGCKKTLTLDSYLDHGEDPYCKPCHGKLFGIKGFGFGMSASVLSTYPTEQAQGLATGISEPAATEKYVDSAPAAAAAPISAPLLAPVVRQSAPVPAPAPAPVRQAAPASRVSKFGAGAPKCTCCNKSVYAAEKVQAINRIWHKSCFTCGGTGSDGGCKKTLTLDSYLDHGEDPYCKPCHGKLFGIKGFGYGMSASVLSTYPTE